MTPEERDRDAGIRADIASGQFSGPEIASRWGVHRSTVYYKRHQRPGRTNMVTEKGSAPDVPLVAAPFARERVRATRKWVPYSEYVTERPPAPPPLPVTPRPATRPLSKLEEWKAKNTLTNQQATRAHHDLEALGWRAECVSLGDNLSTVEVRDMSQRHMPLVARLRTMRDVLRFEGLHPRCPPRGRALPETITPGSQPWRSKSKRDKDQEQRWPPMASVTSGAVHHANDLDY